MMKVCSKRFVGTTLTLFGIWLLLSGLYDPLHMAEGLLCAVLVAWLQTRSVRSSGSPFLWRRFLRYLPWLLTRIVMSSFHVAYLALHPRAPISPRLIRYRTQLCDRAAIVLLANSITLTPGTITADVASQELVVHAIDDASAGDLLNGEMERRVARVFNEPGQVGRA